MSYASFPGFGDSDTFSPSARSALLMRDDDFVYEPEPADISDEVYAMRHHMPAALLDETLFSIPALQVLFGELAVALARQDEALIDRVKEKLNKAIGAELRPLAHARLVAQFNAMKRR